MSRLLLDTSALSAFLRGHEGITGAVRTASRIAVNPIVLGELDAGFRGGTKYESNQRLVQRFLGSPRVRIVGIGKETAGRYAKIFESLRRGGTPIPTNDIWIAASAMQFGLTVVATDGHYRYVNEVLVDLYPI